MRFGRRILRSEVSKVPNGGRSLVRPAGLYEIGFNIVNFLCRSAILFFLLALIVVASSYVCVWSCVQRVGQLVFNDFDLPFSLGHPSMPSTKPANQPNCKMPALKRQITKRITKDGCSNVYKRNKPLSCSYPDPHDNLCGVQLNESHLMAYESNHSPCASCKYLLLPRRHILKAHGLNIVKKPYLCERCLLGHEDLGRLNTHRSSCTTYQLCEVFSERQLQMFKEIASTLSGLSNQEIDRKSVV